MPEEPLAGREVSRSRDFDEFRDALNRYFYPAKVEQRGPKGTLVQPLLSAARLSMSTVGFVHFGGVVSVDPGDLGGYHVNIPLRGKILSYCGQDSVLATPSTAAVFTPGHHTFLPAWDEQTPQWCWKIDRRAVEREMELLLGRSLPRPLEFGLSFDLSTPEGLRWMETFKLMISYVNAVGPSSAATHHIENLERSLISGLLLTHRHSLFQLLEEMGSSPARPRTLRKVLNAIEDDPAHPYTLGDLTALAGVSARQLQYAFKDNLGVTPLEYLRQARLEMARNLLMSSDRSVTDVAMSTGFNHLGKFSQYYRQRYGEAPSSTQQRTRRTVPLR